MKKLIIILLGILTLIVVSCENKVSSTKTQNLDNIGTPDKLLTDLEQAINSKNLKKLERIFSDEKSASAFKIFLGKNVRVSSKSQIIGRNEKYSYIKGDINQMTKDSVSDTETENAITILNISTENSGITAYTQMKKFSDGWKISSIDMFYLDFPNTIVHDYGVNWNFFGFGIDYNPNLDKQISKIEFQYNNNLICSSNKINYKVSENEYGKMLLVDTKECNFESIFKDLQKEWKYVLLELKVYLNDGKMINGVFLKRLSRPYGN